MQYDFYVAGPFFNDAQVASMERIEAVLDRHGKSMFKPRFASDINEVGPQGCFADDVDAIRHADAVIANLIADDPGTMFEIGYAYALGKPVYAYCEDVSETRQINLMIAQSVQMVFAGADDLDTYLTMGAHTNVAFPQF